MSESTSGEAVLSVEQLYEDNQKSVARIALRGLNRRIINHRSTTTYEVLSGTGVMDVDGTIHQLAKGVVVTIPAGTPYHDEGFVDMQATSVPPFDVNQIEFLT